MKLQQGDYVTNLTEEQFEELVKIEGHEIKLTFKNTLKTNTNIYVRKFYESVFLSVFKSNMTSTELTFEEFRQRAINTFKG